MYWHIQILEINGEQEYIFHRVIETKTYEQAKKKSEEIAKTWYDDKYEKENNYYVFGCGYPAIKVDRIEETNKDIFFNYFVLQ